MLPTPRLIIAAFATLLLLPFASADEQMEQVLAELKALREQVATLEARLEAVEGQASETAEQVASAPVAVAPREKKSFFDNMRVELKKAEVRASGAWTDPAVWDQISDGQTKEEVVAILGEPTRFKFSVRRDTDEILIYEGDLEGTGEPIEGEIRIYKGKVRRFSVPDFPASE